MVLLSLLDRFRLAYPWRSFPTSLTVFLSSSRSTRYGGFFFSPQVWPVYSKGDLRLLDPPSGRAPVTELEPATDRRAPTAYLKANRLSTEPPTPPLQPRDP
ncbi:hypothetical protein PoB_007718800 [Plakobranchus ocellatus]|uniref:Uncharacterized protein n=1 Tax=Plakobranchus ocellatus TaxID=259542 RepID=A0AAV4E248_9GAST|nr:hypothetical protein PoB_007718800 [Plakobranchus ocellatus]